MENRLRGFIGRHESFGRCKNFIGLEHIMYQLIDPSDVTPLSTLISLMVAPEEQRERQSFKGLYVVGSRSKIFYPGEMKKGR